MKIFYLAILGSLLFFSCASSQNTAIKREAQKKVEHLTPLLSLSNKQAKSMIEIEKGFLQDSTKINSTKANKADLDRLKSNRKSQVKQLLSREQYIKWDLIESNRIKKVPVRSN